MWGGEVGPGRLILGANLQGRYNPKQKSSLRFGDSPENNPNFATADFDNREDQSDTRDGTDTSFNASYQVDLTSNTALELAGFFVNTDRDEIERSFEYNDRTAVNGPVPTGNLLTDNDNKVKIDQSNYNVRARLTTESDLGETQIRIALASNDQSEFETEDEIDFGRSTPRYTGDLTLLDLEDTETTLDLQHEFDLGNNMAFSTGVFWNVKDRDTSIRAQRNRFNVASAPRTWNQFQSNPIEFRRPWDNPQPIAGGFNTIEEDRLDFFGALEGTGDRVAWEMGLRYEGTDISINDREALSTTETDYGFLLPSAHFRYDLTDTDRVTGSVARTVRRPNFNFISPALLEAELGDNDLLGNPLLDPETAWGFDIGYEHRIGTAGVVGINVFWRDISDLIEVANTGAEGSEGPGTFIYTPRNTGDGEVSGIEFDLSAPLSFAGLDNTGVFLNYSILDSEVNDEFGSRAFNDQSPFVYNVGSIQDLPATAAAFGLTYRKQDDAFGRVTGEEIITRYGAEMELFVEKRFGDDLTVRLVGSNLLDGTKDEDFNKFATTGDQRSRDFDEYELESERAGQWYQLMVRYAF